MAGKIIAVVMAIILGVVSSVALSLFVIGSPLDGGNVGMTVAYDGDLLRIKLETPSSGEALCGLEYHIEGDTLVVDLRRVLVSSIHRSGRLEFSVDGDGIEHIKLGDKTVEVVSKIE